MFLPLHDANRLRHIKAQFVTLGLIAANTVLWLFTQFGTEDAQRAAVLGFAYIPAVTNDFADLPPEFVYLHENFSYITYAFLHGDFFHLLGNMLFLWVFGDNVEDALGHVKFLVFYLASAAAGAFTHGLVSPDSEIPLIGASGAVAGVVAAYLMLHPKVKVWVLFLGRLPLRLPAWILIVLWIGFQIVMFFALPDDQVSWATHLGGIAAGLVLVVILKRRGVPLFDREIVMPRAAEIPPPLPFEVNPVAPPRRWGR